MARNPKAYERREEIEENSTKDTHFGIEGIKYAIVLSTDGSAS